jgi:hypothetical protein
LSVDEIKTQLTTTTTALRDYRARDQVEDYVADKSNASAIKNVRAFCRYFKDDFEWDKDGKITNLKELYKRAKAETPELLGTVQGSVDASAGTGRAAITNGDMNRMIRQAAGRI